MQPFAQVAVAGDTTTGTLQVGLFQWIESQKEDLLLIEDLETATAEIQSGDGLGTQIWLDATEDQIEGFATLVGNLPYTTSDETAFFTRNGVLDIPRPETHRKLTLVAKRDDGSQVDITLLRSLEWIGSELGEEASAWATATQHNTRLHLSIPELKLNGYADVLSIGPCPLISTGAGEVVTATYVTDKANVIDLTFENSDGPICTTAEHPFWSETRQKFVEAGKLEIGEEVLTLNGQRTRLSDITPRAGPETVYNFEVANQHVYYVSQDGLLVHNAKYASEVFEQLRDVALHYRKAAVKGAKRLLSGRNVAVVRYLDPRSGKFRLVKAMSERGVGHAEKLAIREIQRRIGKNAAKQNITHIYSELSFCGNCSKFIANNAPNAQRDYLTKLSDYKLHKALWSEFAKRWLGE